MRKLWKFIMTIINLLTGKKIPKSNHISVITDKKKILEYYPRSAEDNFSDEQKEIMLYGIKMGLDIRQLTNRYLTPEEMSKHLQVLIVEKYLGKDYLKNLAKEGRYLSDNDVQADIRRKLNDDIVNNSMDRLDEIACTSEDIVDKNKYMSLCNRLDIAGIDSSLLSLDTTEKMGIVYFKLLSRSIHDSIVLAVSEMDNISKIIKLENGICNIIYRDGRAIKYICESINDSVYYFSRDIFVLIDI